MPTSRLQTLQAEANELVAERDTLISAAERRAAETGGPRGFQPQERSRIDAIASRLAQIDDDVQKDGRQRQASRDQAATVIDEAAFGAVVGSVRAPEAEERRLAVLQARPGISGRTFAELFGRPRAASVDGWGSFEEFLGVLQSGHHDGRMTAATSMGGTVGSEGGFLVPETYTAELLDAALEDEIVRPRARVYPITQGETRNIAGFDGRDHSDNIYGFAGVWMAESTTNTPQKGKTRLIKLTGHKLAIFANASNELVADGMTFEELLGDAMRQAVGFDVDEACLTGTGAGKPLGVLHDPALITVAKETGQANDTILVENLDKMFARMHPRGRQSAVWVANSTAIPQLLSLVRVVGTGGSAVPVLSETNGQFTLLTRPVVFTEKVPTLGDAGDISFIDFSQYAIGLRKEAVIDRSNAPGWFEDEQSYRVIIRIDGRGRWAAPLTPRNGDTLSWAVTLGAR